MPARGMKRCERIGAARVEEAKCQQKTGEVAEVNEASSIPRKCQGRACARACAR